MPTTTHPTAVTHAATGATTGSADNREVATDTRRRQRFRALTAHHQVTGTTTRPRGLEENS